MTTFEKVKALLELNTLRGVAVKMKGGNWKKVFTYINGKGCLVGTVIERNLEDCLCGGLTQISYNEGDLAECFTDEIIPIPMKPKVLPVGTKVRILECPNFDGLYQGRKEMLCGIFRITDVNDDSYGVSYFVGLEDNISIALPSYCVVPVFEDENPEKKALQDNIERMEKEIAEMKERVGGM